MSGPLYPSLPKHGTNYVIADPPATGPRNWFIKWYRVGAGTNWVHVYREWPAQSESGWWAEMRPDITARADGKRRFDGYPGPAQRWAFAPGIVAYKKLILEAEGWVWDEEAGHWDGSNAEKIQERYIDPRAGGVEVPSLEEGTSIITMMAEEQKDARGRIIGPEMIWQPAPGGGGASNTMQGQELLNERLNYDDKREINVLNCPKWYVVDTCKQSILAYTEYTGADGDKGALKDIVDPDLYLARVDPEHIDDASMKCSGPNGDDED